jgi:hypothetical protein
VLEAITGITDDYNGNDAYYLPDSELATFETVNEFFVLYAISRDQLGSFTYEKVLTGDMPLSSSADLFLKRRTSEEFVKIFSISRLDKAAYSDLGVGDRTVAVLYSSACFRRKLIERYIADIDLVKGEQAIMKKIADIVSTTLTAVGEGYSSESTPAAADTHSSPVALEVWVFMITRGLISKESLLNSSSLSSIKACAQGLPAIIQEFQQAGYDFYSEEGFYEACEAVRCNAAACALVADALFTMEALSAWADILRMHGEQVNADGNMRVMYLQTTQQAAGEAALTASNILKATGRTRMDAAAGVR